MTCTFSTFETNLTPSRNAAVDDIVDYLHKDCDRRYYNPAFGALKMALDMEVIVPLGQDEVMQNEFGNYAEIVQSDRIWYYFILSCEWTSKAAVKLKLSIDSVNTFKDDLVWGPQTTIERQHMDRLKEGGDGRLYRLIDPEPEDIQTAKHMQVKSTMRQNNSNINWYLIYDSERSDDTSTPIRCRCLADQGLVVYKSAGGEPAQTWTGNDLTTGWYRYINSADNASIVINYSTTIWHGITPDTAERDLTIGDYVAVLNNQDSNVYWTGNISGFCISRTTRDGKPAVRIGMSFDNVHEYRTSTHPQNIIVVGGADSTPLNTGNAAGVVFHATIKQLTSYRNSTEVLPIPYTNYIIPDSDKVDVNIGSVAVRTTIPFSQVDRTDSRLIKIINLPYAPCEVTYNPSTGVYTFPSEWRFENGYMRLNDASLNTEFESTVGNISLTSKLIDTSDTHLHRNALNSRMSSAESKLYNSQFHTCKLVYDSFALSIPLEDFHVYEEDALGVEGHENDPILVPVKFKPSNTMNSHFAFHAEIYDSLLDNVNLEDGMTYWERSDYSEYLVTTRNNEEPIFSSAYLDYIRNGYNYDKKVKADQNAWTLAMGGLQVAGAIASFAVKGFTGGISIATGISLATSAVTTFASAAHNDNVAGDKLDQKLKELAMQSVGVSGADDVDLLKYYNNNKLLWVEYVTDDYERKALLDLFHYCGYKHAHHEVPNTTSRFWFNFIQCAPVFVNEETSVWTNYLDDIRGRYRAGVTVYHRHEGILEGSNYDWDQAHENWEVALATPKMQIKWIPTHGISDVRGFNFTYNGPYVLDGTKLYVEWSWENLEDPSAPIVTGTSQGQRITSGMHWYSETPGSYDPPCRTRWRIVSTTPLYISSDWGETVED